MGLALCHSIPRDITVQIGLLFFGVAFVLQAAAIGLHYKKDGGGYFTIKGGSSSRSHAVVVLAAHPATYIPPTSSLYPSDSSGYVKLCNPSADTLTYACARFAESFHIVNGLTVTCFITTVAVVVLGVAAVVRLSHSTLMLLFRLVCLGCVPVALQCAAVGCFFARIVPHARRSTAAAGNWAYGDVKFHRRHAANLMIAATALCGAGLLLFFVRWVSYLCLRAKFVRGTEHTQTDVKMMTESYLVNDDWMRQKQILLSHAQSVQVEVAVKKPRKKDQASGSPTARNSEPFPPHQTDSSFNNARQTEHPSRDDSGADTLHFRATSIASPSRTFAASGHSTNATAAIEHADGEPKAFEPTTGPGPHDAAATAAVTTSDKDTRLNESHPFSDAEGRDSRGRHSGRAEL